MAVKKGYKGYKAFDYLTPGKDYKEFDMAPEYNMFAGANEYLPLTEEEAAIEQRIVEKYPMISLHEHPFRFPRDMWQTFDYCREGRAFTAYQALAESNWDCVFDNLMDGFCAITSKRGWKWDDVLYDLGMRLCDIAHQDFLIKCEKVDDILRAKAEGKVAWVPVLEGAAILENEVDRVDILHGFGIRSMGITYNDSNTLGGGLKEERDSGLTAFGREVVERMNKVGIAIDCAHCGPQTTLDTIAASSKPIFISHVGAKALWGSRRLQSDEVLTACAAKGGVVGVEASPHTTITEDLRTHTLESVMAHFEYIKDLVGIDHVAFGPDTLFGNHVQMHQVFNARMSISSVFAKLKPDGTVDEYPRVQYVKYLENPNETSYNILRWLIKHGYSDEEIGKVMGGNILRVLGEVW